MVPFVSGSGKIKMVSKNDKEAIISKGIFEFMSSNDMTIGESMEPILENITLTPTPAFLTTVG